MNSKLVLFLILTLVGCLASVSSDIYAPSLSAISADLSTHIDHVQWSMAVFMFGLALSQLIYGPLSEGIGRKNTLLIGISISILGNIISILAPNISCLILGRLIQGLGLGAAATMWRAIFRDRFEGAEMAKYSSYLTILIILIVPAAPTLGGYLQDAFGWRASFAFILAYSTVVLLAVIFLFRETNEHQHTERLKMSHIKAGFKDVLSHKTFLSYSLCTFLSYGAFFAWYNAGPVLLMEGCGLTEIQFGWFTFVVGGAAMALAGFLNGRLTPKLGIPTMLRAGWSLMVLAGALLLLSYYIFSVSFIPIAIPFFIFYFGATFIWPGCFASAFQDFGKKAGYAASCYGAIQMGGAALIGSLVSYLPDENQLPLAFVFMGCATAAWFVFERFINMSS